MVLIDSIAPRRAATAGRSAEAERLEGAERDAFLGRLRDAAKMGAEEYGLEVTIHAHAAGYVEFEDEIERVIDAIDPALLGICLDTGHSLYAGIDPTDFYERHADRVTYLHFKDIDPVVRERVIAERIGFYDACAAGLLLRPRARGRRFRSLPARARGRRLCRLGDRRAGLRSGRSDIAGRGRRRQSRLPEVRRAGVRAPWGD